LDNSIWPGIWNLEWDRRFDELYGYDLTKAKALLTQAGYPHEFEFTMYLYTLPGLPEIIDIGQAMALDFQTVGLKPKLVEIDFPRVREMYRTKTIHGALFPLRHGLRAWIPTGWSTEVRIPSSMAMRMPPSMSGLKS
jgi:ABC-type transport system substrate-binding protein